MSRLLTFIVCLFFCLSQASSPIDCRNFVDSVWHQRSSPVPVTPEQKAYFANSGVKGRYDLGERANCEEDELTRYYVLALIVDIVNSTTGGFVQAETGICVPAYCSKEVLLADRMMLQKLFETNRWNIPRNAKVTVYDINEAPPRGAGFVLIMLFISCLAALGIYSTVVLYQKKKKSQGKENTEANQPKSRLAVLLDKYFWVFKAFDLRENGKSLYVTAKEVGQSEQISTFGLLRSFASIWIVIVHTRNVNVYKNEYKLPSDLGIETFMIVGILGVEYFLFLGGFLAAYTLIGKALREGVGIRKYFSDIFHRLVRVWPPLFFAIIFYWVLVPGLINGPLMGRFVGSVKVCNQIWWNKLLMIDNYFPYQPGSGCLGVTWYLDVDFQVYFSLLLIVFAFVKKRRLGYFLVFAMMAFSIYYSIDRFWYGVGRGNTMSFWYINALPRAYEVMIGVVFGFQYYEYVKEKSKKNFFALCEKYTDLRYLLIALGIYLNYLAATGVALPEWETLRRIAACVGTAFIFLPLANETLSFIRVIMNLRIFQILGKLSFGIYLLHFPIIMAITYTQDHYPEEYDQGLVLVNALKAVLITIAVSIPYYLLFEKPIMNIESHFTRKAKAGPAKKPAAASAKIQDKLDTKQPNQQTMEDDMKISPMVMIEIAPIGQLDPNAQVQVPTLVDQTPSPVEVELQEGLGQGDVNLLLPEASIPSTSHHPISL